MSVVTAVKNPKFEKAHPRGKDGKFISKGGVVRWLRNGLWLRGKVLDWSDDGSTITVERVLKGGKPGPKEDVPRTDIISDRSAKAYIDVKKLKKTGKATAGSNPAGIFEDPNDPAVSYYVKQPKTADHVRNEDLANRLYAALGFAVPETSVTQDEKQFASKIEDIKGDGNITDINTFGPQMAKGFVVDAWLANWDVAVYHNLAELPDGTPFRVDNGGSMLFRARGERRQFGATVGELQSMRDKPGYKGMTKADEIEGAKKVLAITPDEIDELVESSGLPPSLATVLKQRRKYIASHYGLTLPETTDEGKAILSALPDDGKKLTSPDGIDSRVDALDKVISEKPAPMAIGSPVYLIGHKNVLASKFRGRSFVRGEISKVDDKTFTVTSPDGKSSIELDKPSGDVLDGPGWAIMRPDGIPVGVRYKSGGIPQIGDRVRHEKEGDGTILRAENPKYVVVSYDSGKKKASSLNNLTQLEGDKAADGTSTPAPQPKSSVAAAFDKIGTRFTDDEVANFEQLALGSLTPTKVFVPEYGTTGIVSKVNDSGTTSVVVSRADGGTHTVTVGTKTLIKPETADRDAAAEWRELASTKKRRVVRPAGPKKATGTKTLNENDVVTKKIDGRPVEVRPGQLLVKLTSTRQRFDNGKKNVIFRLDTRTGAIDFVGPDVDSVTNPDSPSTARDMWHTAMRAYDARWTDLTPNDIKAWNTENDVSLSEVKDTRLEDIRIHPGYSGLHTGEIVAVDASPGDHYQVFTDNDRPGEAVVIRRRQNTSPDKAVSPPDWQLGTRTIDRDKNVTYEIAVVKAPQGSARRIDPGEWEAMTDDELRSMRILNDLNAGTVPDGFTPDNTRYMSPQAVKDSTGTVTGQWYIPGRSGQPDIVPPTDLPEIRGFRSWKRSGTSPYTYNYRFPISREAVRIAAPTSSQMDDDVLKAVGAVKKTDEGVVFTWDPVLDANRGLNPPVDVTLKDGTFLLELKRPGKSGWDSRAPVHALLVVNEKDGTIELHRYTFNGRYTTTATGTRTSTGLQALGEWRSLVAAHEDETGTSIKDITPKPAIASYTDTTIPQKIDVSLENSSARHVADVGWTSVAKLSTKSVTIDVDDSGFFKMMGKASYPGAAQSDKQGLVVQTKKKGDKFVPVGYIRVPNSGTPQRDEFDRKWPEVAKELKKREDADILGSWSYYYVGVGELPFDEETATVRFDMPDTLDANNIATPGDVGTNAANIQPKASHIRDAIHGPKDTDTFTIDDAKPWRPHTPKKRAQSITADDVADDVDTGNLAYKLPGSRTGLVDGTFDEDIEKAFTRALDAAGANITRPYRTAESGNDSEGNYHNDVLLGELVRELGAGEKPLVVDDSTFDTLRKAQGGVSYHRGVTETWQRDAQLFGDFFGGYGVYGNGTYGSTHRSTAVSYARSYGRSTKGTDALLAEFLVKPETTVTDFDEVMDGWYEDNVATGHALMNEMNASGGIVASVSEVLPDAVGSMRSLENILGRDTDTMTYLADARAKLLDPATENKPSARAAIITYVRAKKKGLDATFRSTSAGFSGTSEFIVEMEDGSQIIFVNPSDAYTARTGRARRALASRGSTVTVEFYNPATLTTDAGQLPAIRRRFVRNGETGSSVISLIGDDRMTDIVRLSMRAGAITDPGRWALLSGIDAFETQVGSGEKYVIVTHRGPLIYRKPKG